MDAALREVVRVRAGNRCEYCRVRQEHVPFALLQIEHVRPKKHGGDDSVENLALACNRCNLSKGPNLAGIDPETRTAALLFNPREQRWEEHLAHRGALIEGLTPTGRATVRVLNMNERHRVQLREELIRLDPAEGFI